MVSDKEWVKALKVGDVVVYDRGSFYGNNYIIDKVAKITPTGIFKTEKGMSFKPDGEVRGSEGWFCLQPLTNEIILHLQKRKILSLIRTTDLTKLPDEKLREIYKIIKGDDINEETSAV